MKAHDCLCQFTVFVAALAILIFAAPAVHAGLTPVPIIASNSSLTTVKIYWTDSGTDKIQRADLDGNNVEDLITTGLSIPRGIALDVPSSKMYWVDFGSNKIHRADLDGSNVEDLVTSGLSGLWGIALDPSDGKMYWVDSATDKIQRANLDGSNVEDVISTGLGDLYNIALDLYNGKVYWADYSYDKIQRANLDGSNLEDLVTVDLSGPLGIALDPSGGKMYWTDYSSDKIQRANLDGSSVEDLITTGLDGPWDIALDPSGGKMYWTDYSTNKIQRANLDGSSVEDLVTGLVEPAGIAIPYFADDLMLEPTGNFVVSGDQGGPFTPGFTTYTLTNDGPNSLDWTATVTEPWLDVVPTSGTLGSNDSIFVEVSINADANTLTAGVYNDVVTFTNTTSGVTQLRNVTLYVATKRVLAYTQYVGSTESANTLSGIDSVSTNYVITEMDDYTQLDSMLAGHDVLLIPEQQNTNLSQLETIGTVWSATVEDFINNGGVVIQCDSYNKYGILTGAGLMDISSSSSCSYSTVNVTAPADPIVQGVSSSYYAEYASSYYNTTETEMVVELTGSGPVVINKEIGLGNVVLIGHDYYYSNSDQDLIIGNAVFNLPSMKDDLIVIPHRDLTSWGDEGGPFDPCLMEYALENIGDTSLNWTAGAGESWLDVTPGNGTLDPGEYITVAVCINANADTLPPGVYSDVVTFTNTTSGESKTRDVTVKVAPKKILSYIQYTNTSREYPNTLAGINSVSTNYVITEMDDYTQLDSMLAGHDVLLIPEQQNTNLSQLETIGTVWSATVEAFINNGGVVIQCDYSGKYGILTGAGLMDISSSSICSNSTVTVTAPADPIAQGVSGSYTARSYSSLYFTTETETVVELAGSGPVVINKELGWGNVVLIGHDYYYSNSDQDLIVGNAVFNLPGIKDNLAVTPSVSFTSWGDEGGPFDPCLMEYTLENIGDTSLNWTAGAGESWLDVTPGNGTLDPGEYITVAVCINANADTLPPGVYSDVVTFTNTTSGESKTRDVTLKVAPKKILAYTQYVSDREYGNTMVGINSVSANYVITELDDYTQLDSMLPGHDILLIPEQQSASSSTLETIGTAWSSTIQDFAFNGGVVIQCDSYDKYGILTGAGLMDISSSSECQYNYVTVTAPDDPVVQGVSSSYYAEYSSSCYFTTETETVVELAGSGPVVINKELGWGNVVLIGHDYYYSNSDQDLIIGNAVFNLPGIKDNLAVTPSANFTSWGDGGGPFDPCCMEYTLENIGETSLNWTAGAGESWLDVTPGSGTLNSGEYITVQVCINANADTLPPEVYTDVVTFTNTTSGESKTRDVTLKVAPKKILAYTQYVSGREYGNTMVGINSVSANYVITELDDYTQLDSMLPGHDVLLIPEQQNTNLSQLETIGTAWSSTIQDFAFNGGVVIQCDSYDKYGILTGAGLMDISSSGDCSYSTVNVTAPADPIVQGVSSSYYAEYASSYYNTTETEMVVELAGSGPVVINKELGWGNVVLIGHDYYYSSSDQDLIIGNAVFNLPGIKDNLAVTPSVSFTSWGDGGGPFDPCLMEYALENIGDTSLNWTAGAGESWLDVTPGSGILNSGEFITVQVCINANADTLPPGVYSDVVTFTNTTSGESKTRDVTVKVAPKKILSYIQYTNTSREYPNTLAGIDSVSTNYVITELDDYTQLDSMLPGHDVLLIPEQQNTNLSQLETIGTAWSSTIQDFAFNGGVVIQCDSYSKYGILTGASLMNISSSGNCQYNYVCIIDPDDPVVQGVSSCYYAEYASSYYDTADGVVVVEYPGYGPVVINKKFGAGNVVLIGHDYSYSNSDQDLIVGNAVFNLDDLIVTPLEDFFSQGNDGGPFYPSCMEYALENIGDTSLNWTAGASESWLDVTPGNGTLDPGEYITVAVCINGNADTLPPGVYTDVVTFTNTTSGESKTRDVTLQVLSAGMLFYDSFPSTTLNSSNWPNTDGEPTIDDVGIGEPSEPYSLRLNAQSNQNDLVQSRVIDLSGTIYGQVWLKYCYQRTGGGNNPESGEDLIFQYLDGLNWVELTKHLGSGEDMTEYECIEFPLPGNALHTSFMLRIGTTGSYCDDWFVDDVSIMKLNLCVEPMEDFDTSDYQGEITPSSKNYTLTNCGSSTLNWTANISEAWLGVDPCSGSLEPMGYTTVEVYLNANADILLPGDYNDTVTFIDDTMGGLVHSRDVTLTVWPKPGEIEVDPNKIDFGDVIIGLPQTEQITITNTDPDYDLIIYDIHFATIEDFEDGDISEYTILGGTHIVSNAAAHDGDFGLESEGGSLNNWIYREDSAVIVSQGDTISYWVCPRASGRAYSGFGASAAGTYSITVAPNTNQLILHLISNYSSYIVLAAVPQSWTYDKWYRLEVEWGIGGNITGRLFDSDGTTLLNTVTANDSTYAYGGIGFRAFGSGTLDYFDTVRRFGAASASSREEMASCLPSPADVVLPNPADAIGWDEENQALVFDKSELARVPYGCEGSRVMLPDIMGESFSGFLLENEPNLPAIIPPQGEITFDVVFDPTEFGGYENTIIIQSNDEDEPEVKVQLSGVGIADYLEIIPGEEEIVEFSGHPGGPFVPSRILYQLTNNHPTESIDWFADWFPSWLDVDSSSGTLVPGEHATVELSINANAYTLPEGEYSDPCALIFTDVFTTLEQPRPVTLSVFTTPKMWTHPDSFNVTVRQGQTAMEVLTIGNTGDADLNFSLVGREIRNESSMVKITAAEIEMTEEKIILEYVFGQPTVSQTGEYDLVHIEGLEQYQRTGAPIVPIYPVKVLVPQGKKVTTTIVVLLDTHELPGIYCLPPAQKPHPLSHQGMMEITHPNSAIYDQITSWPGINYEELGTQSKRGYQLFSANLFPLQFIPATGKISYTSKLRLEIDLAKAQSGNLLKSSDEIKTELARTIDNPSMLEWYPSEDSSEDKLDGMAPLPGGGPYQYVIITNEALKSASGPWNFQALRDAKIGCGIGATIVTTEWIYANYDGTRPDGASDNQTRIRNFLIDAYQEWGTEYALLGGTNGIVPARKFWVDSTLIPADMYYGCVDPEDCTFDYDSDGYYGEPTDGVGGGEVDLYAEIYVGRAAVENATELKNFIKKTLTYDLTQNDYLPFITMLGEYLGFGGVSQYAKDSMEQIRLGGYYDSYFTYGFENHLNEIFIDFDTSTNLYDKDSIWPKETLIDLMNAGTHVFNHLGHANYTYDMKLYTPDLSYLTNTDYFFVYSQGCMPGGFDTTNCFAEVITSMEHGAFAVVMNARYGYGRYSSTDGPSQRFDRQFWDAVLDEDMPELGRANQDSKEDNLWDINGDKIRWCCYELNLFGDPEQKFRFSQSCDWLDIIPDFGTVASNDANEVYIVFEPGNISPGIHQAEIIVSSNDEHSQRIYIPITMTVEPDYLVVMPEDSFAFRGTQGGPFISSSAEYTLENIGDNPLDWSASVTADWLDVDPCSSTLNPGDPNIVVTVYLNANADTLPSGVYTEVVTFTNTTSGVEKTRTITLMVLEIDHFTELFDLGDNNLSNQSLIFTPDGSESFYSVCRTEAYEFPTDPGGGITLSLQDDDYQVIILGESAEFWFYGESFSSFYVGSNGYVTFGTGDTARDEGLEEHFIFRRVSGLFDDLNPNAGGQVSWKQLSNRVAVTFENIPEYQDSNSNSFQIELFFDGTIRITWLQITATDGLAGLSQGYGMPFGFQESDLTNYNLCPPVLTVDLDMDNLWMYQNLPERICCTLTASASITDPIGNNGYTYDWEFILPSDVHMAPTTVAGGGTDDPNWTFAAPGCDEPNGISDSGQAFTVRVTVTGDDYGNTATVEAQFGIALLGDVNNDGVVNLKDRQMVNDFWQMGTATGLELRDCDVNCDAVVNLKDRSLTNDVWQRFICRNSVSSPCPFH